MLKLEKEQPRKLGKSGVDWDKVDLYELYWTQCLSLRQIALKFGVCTSCVKYALTIRRIPRRTCAETKISQTKTKFPKELIESLYWEKHLCGKEIAKELNIGSTSVFRLLSRYSIPTRPPKRVIELVSEEELKQLYLEEELSMKEIANEFNIDERSVVNLLRFYSIPLRNASEVTTAYFARNPAPCGSEHGNWKGGIRHCRGGYTQIYNPNHHRANTAGYVLEHILVWESVNNKELPDGWIIHHANGIPDDNRPVNLVAMSDNKHKRLIPLLQKRIQELEAKLKGQGQLC